MIVPYIDIQFAKNNKELEDIIKTIIIGPSDIDSLTKRSVELFLDNQSVNDIKIFNSSIPYRNFK
ncbi:unnamed protein product [marine sediment metagenome]|uniref:Uncharacterized protein n=1 Tax=marine sediment metagenome TaxID=412755 RepID=X1GKT2_9ZZZZ